MTLIRSFLFLGCILLQSYWVLGQEEAQQPLPIDAWVTFDVASAQLSHDGTYLALVRDDPNREGHRIVWVYTFDANGELEVFRRINSENMRIGGIDWLSDQHFIMGLRQQVRNRIEGFNQGVYKGKVQIVDVATGEFLGIPVQNPGIVHLLPNEPFKVIVSDNPSGPQSGRLNRDGSFLSSFYELNLKTMKTKLLLRSRISLQSYRFDKDGNPNLAVGFDRSSLETVFKYRPPDKDTWREFARVAIDDFDLFAPVGEDPSKPEHEYVLANNGGDKVALWSYNKRRGSFEDAELIYGRNDVDIFSAISHTNRLEHFGEVAGVVFSKDGPDYVYFPEYELEGAIRKQFRELVENGASTSVVSVSRDGKTMVVANSGPTSPSTYYLFRGGTFKRIGTSMPEVPPEALSETTYIEYKARDGRTIPGHVTTPAGEPPFPLIVMPHGGPFVSEFIGFDPWAQMLANNGYMVLQPQYRGSQNFGLEFYQSAFIEKSEAGYAMQDDKDDGALHLVEQGLVDPDRMAMWGWSYGGYAALVASMRTPQIYQCAVAGAAVSDPIMQVNYYRYRMDGVQKTEQLNTWDGARSPYDDYALVNIPLFIIHGVNDQRVPITHSRKFVKRLESSNADFRYTEIDGIDHFSNTMNRSHLTQLYTELLDYLAHSCGPDGL